MADANKIVQDFVNYISKNGGIASEWYTGIANEPEDRLSQHKATNTRWIYDYADSESYARQIEEHMIKKIGTKGGGGGGDEKSKGVYCYKITPSTIEDTS